MKESIAILVLFWCVLFGPDLMDAEWGTFLTGALAGASSGIIGHALARRK